VMQAKKTLVKPTESNAISKTLLIFNRIIYLSITRDITVDNPLLITTVAAE
jgi:hypothetical protein